MKHLIITFYCILSCNLFAQKPNETANKATNTKTIECDYATDVTDSIGTYKSTKEYLVSEKVFGGNSSYIFYSLALTDGLPTLNLQLIQKSKDFMKANCFDKNSK